MAEYLLMDMSLSKPVSVGNGQGEAVAVHGSRKSDMTGDRTELVIWISTYMIFIHFFLDDGASKLFVQLDSDFRYVSIVTILFS